MTATSTQAMEPLTEFPIPAGTQFQITHGDQTIKILQATVDLILANSSQIFWQQIPFNETGAYGVFRRNTHEDDFLVQDGTKACIGTDPMVCVLSYNEDDQTYCIKSDATNEFLTWEADGTVAFTMPPPGGILPNQKWVFKKIKTVSPAP